MGKASVSVQMPASFCHQLNMSLLCSATKQLSPGPLFILLHPSPASVPGISSSCAPRVAQGYQANKTLGGVSAWGAWKPASLETYKAMGNNGFCWARLEPSVIAPFFLLTSVGLSSEAYQRKGNVNRDSWECLPPGFGLLSAAWFSLPVSQVPQRRQLALCPLADLLPCCSRNSLTVAVTFEGYKRDTERKYLLLEQLGVF